MAASLALGPEMTLTDTVYKRLTVGYHLSLVYFVTVIAAALGSGLPDLTCLHHHLFIYFNI